jgi:glycosyltransferase 2 family protein
MEKRRLYIYALFLLVFGVLVYFQFRTWRNFDWPTFWSQQVSPIHLIHAIAYIYIGYAIRAIRWKIFLRPVRPRASVLKLVAPTVIGFTGLALLGRPGELIRPYLIARREDLSFSSQLGVWAVERIFDIGAFTVLLVLAVLFAKAPKRLAYYGGFREVGLAFTVLVIGLVMVAIIIRRNGLALADWIERRFSHLSANLGHRIALRIREFHGGLDTIHSPWCLVQLIVVSVIMWCIIALSYKEVTIAYGEKLRIPQTQLLLLMGSSMVGSLIQLPGIGGGSQLATITALQRWFDVPKELAASCGIMLWLVTFVSVVPLGLLLAHLERLSFRKLSKESRIAEESTAAT